MISAIVAVDNNWGIGYKGDLLEHIPEDLKYFKEITMNKTVVMGLTTWESLPKKPLPNRTNIVITYEPKESSEAYFWDMETTKKFIDAHKEEEFIIMGGGSIYKQFLPFYDYVYITKIYNEHDNVDTYFPNLDELKDWKKIPVSFIKEYKGIKYQFWLYKKI